MALDNRQSDLESLRIDRSQSSTEVKTPIWARRYIQIGVGILLLLIVVRGLSAVLAGVSLSSVTNAPAVVGLSGTESGLVTT